MSDLLQVDFWQLQHRACREKAYTIRHWLSRGIDYTKIPRDVASPYRTPTFRRCLRSFSPSPCLRTRRIPVAKGLYRAPSNLPELLVVMLCKRPHFVTIAPALPPPPCYASQCGAEKLRSWGVEELRSTPVCSYGLRRVRRSSSTFSRPDKIVPYVSRTFP